ncbi:MAG: helix-turn-helix domain-containing protein [Candidatus Hodarchaeota archaeon]
MIKEFVPKRLVRVREAAALLGLSERWVWLRIAEGALPAVKLRGSTRIALVDLEKFVQQGRLR